MKGERKKLWGKRIEERRVKEQGGEKRSSERIRSTTGIASRKILPGFSIA